MNWQKIAKFIPYLLFLFIILPIFSFLFYRLTDESLSSQAILLLVTDGRKNSELRKNLQDPQAVVILPRDSIFDHKEQVQLIENRFQSVKDQLTNFKKNSMKQEAKKLLVLQIENSLESLYEINPLKLMGKNLTIIESCLLELETLSIPLDRGLYHRIKALEEGPLKLRAARFHLQSVLGSISVLSRASFVQPSIFLIQKQRLANQMAKVSLDTSAVTGRLEASPKWYDTQQYELVYVEFFRRMIADPSVDLKSQILKIHQRLRI